MKFRTTILLSGKTATGIEVPGEVAVPADLAELLERERDAKRAFEGLSYSGKQRLVGPIADARTAETRQHRVDRAIGQLRAGRA